MSSRLSRTPMLAALWACSVLACSPGSRTAASPPAAEASGFYCMEVRPEPGAVTALCKRALEECRRAQEDELAAGAFAGECRHESEAYCMTYELDHDGETSAHSMCMGDQTGCEAIRGQAARDGASRVGPCTVEH